MDVKMEASWKEALREEFNKEYFVTLVHFLKEEYRTQKIYPPGPRMFAAFDYCPFDKVKVVILGQDPYHGPGQANGLSFSVNDGVQIPPSLQNIFKEVQADTGAKRPESGNLERWAEQGVLLLNSVLTVRAGIANSHQKKGWERFTDAVVHKLAEKKEGLVFLLWGSPAAKKAEFVDPGKHLILKSVHPSPLSAERGFFGNHHFTKANEYLSAHGREPIEW
jgi:uracil-DNA glycosylase